MFLIIVFLDLDGWYHDDFVTALSFLKLKNCKKNCLQVYMYDVDKEENSKCSF